MGQKTRQLCAIFLSLSFLLASFSAIQASAEFGNGVIAPAPEWELEKGDWLVFNVEVNTMQFVRGDKTQKSKKYEVGSGEKLEEGKKRCYLGMCYDPLTPEGTWEVRSKNQQNWYNVFGSKEGDEQLFLRLYEINGEQRIRTFYGIHTTPEIETIFSEDDGFGSWGCLLTRYDLLKKIEELYELNEGVITVITTKDDTVDVIALS